MICEVQCLQRLLFAVRQQRTVRPLLYVSNLQVYNSTSCLAALLILLKLTLRGLRTEGVVVAHCKEPLEAY